MNLETFTLSFSLSRHMGAEIERRVQTEAQLGQLQHSGGFCWLIVSVNSFWYPGIWASVALVLPVQQICWTVHRVSEGCNLGPEIQAGPQLLTSDYSVSDCLRMAPELTCMNIMVYNERSDPENIWHESLKTKQRLNHRNRRQSVTSVPWYKNSSYGKQKDILTKYHPAVY